MTKRKTRNKNGSARKTFLAKRARLTAKQARWKTQRNRMKQNPHVIAAEDVIDNKLATA